MAYIDIIKDKARMDKKTIVLPETNDKRTLIAASQIMQEGIANIIMVGNEEKIMDGAGWLEVDLTGVKVVDPETTEKLDEYVNLLYETRKAKGMVGAPLRVMVVGIPNVGKSSFINRMSGSKKAKVEDRPGVTRTKQWVKLGDRIEMLDMPGVLWPKFDDQLVARKLAFTGAIRDDILDIETLAMLLLEYLAENYPACLKERYKMDSEGLDGKELLELLGRKRGMLISGGEVNTERAAIMLLDEFRAGKTGCISLEKPEE